MYQTTIALVCLVCLGHGQQVQALDTITNVQSVVRPRETNQHAKSNRKVDPLKGLALLLVNLDPAADFTSRAGNPHLMRVHGARKLQLDRFSQFRGGAVQEATAPITVRVRTQEGLRRAQISPTAKLLELQQLLQKEYKLPLARQQLSIAGKQPLGEAAKDQSLQDLGIVHGSMLHLQLAPVTNSANVESTEGTAPSTSDSGSAGTSSRAHRKKSMTMADFMDERASHEVVLKAPPDANCSFLCVEPSAAKAFADHMIDLEFEEKRVALLYGRVVEDAGKGKRGVYVDVVYEPPQSCNASSISIDRNSDASAELERANVAARELGLTLVGFAFAHPPRWHTMEVAELASIVEQRSMAGSVDPTASELFVGVRFRAVYEGELIEGEVTAEAYQPTEQASDLIDKGVLLDNSSEPGEAILAKSSGLEFKVGADKEPSAHLSYFVSRVHDLAKPYVPPAFGAFRTSFPVANRGGPPLRKFHLRTFLERQTEAGLPFSTAAADFQLLLHISGIMPADLFGKLCQALPAAASTKRREREEAAKAIREAESWIYNYVASTER